MLCDGWGHGTAAGPGRARGRAPARGGQPPPPPCPMSTKRSVERTRPFGPYFLGTCSFGYRVSERRFQAKLMRGCCDASCSNGGQRCKAGCQGRVPLNYRTSIAHQDGWAGYRVPRDVLPELHNTVACPPNGVSNEHSRSDRTFGGFYCSLDTALGPGGGGGRCHDWAPLTRKRHIPPHPAQPRHTNYWAPRTRKRHRQEHRPQRPTERSDPTQHAKGRADDCPGPRKGTTTRRNVTQGGGGGARCHGRGSRGAKTERLAVRLETGPESSGDSMIHL